MRLLACLIVAPQRGYDEPAILSYAISSFCPTSADGLQCCPRHAGLPARCGSSLQRNDAGVWLCEYPGLSFQRSPVCACSLVSSLLLGGAMMSQQSSLTQSAHSVRQVLTAHTAAKSSSSCLPKTFSDLSARVLEGLRGEDSIAELCRKEGINQNLYYRWS